jgi:hypothetical protein
MSDINFWIPVCYDLPEKTTCQTLTEAVEGYCSFGSQQYRIITSKDTAGVEKVEIRDTEAKGSFANLVMVVLKIVSIFTLVIPLIALIAKLIFRALHNFQVENDKVDIDESTKKLLQKHFKEICEGKDTENVKFHGIANVANKVFSLKKVPGLIFKTSLANNYTGLTVRQECLKQVVENRYREMERARTVCETNHLGLLMIPEACKFSLSIEREDCKYVKDEFTFIAERFIDIEHSDHNQERLYAKNKAKMNELIRQLTVFICKSGFSDVAWRNIPLSSTSLKSILKVVLIDLEEMRSAATGLFGAKGAQRRPGLISCVTPEQAQIVLEEAKKHLKWTEELEALASSALKQRKAEWEFYQHHGLLDDKIKQIEIPKEMMENLKEEGLIEAHQKLLTKFSREVFDYILEDLKSDSAQKEKAEMSTRERRRFGFSLKTVKTITDKSGKPVFLAWLYLLAEKKLIAGYETSDVDDGVTVFA